MKFAIAFLLVFSVSGKALAFSDFAVCSDCYTTSQFTHAAEKHSLSTRLLMSVGVDPVYVVNTLSGEVRFFEVSRKVSGSLQGEGDERETMRASGSAKPADRTNLVSGGYCMAEATEATPDPEVLEILEEAHALLEIAIDIWSRQAIPSDDVPGLEDLESALQLVGPGSAEFWRNQVGVALEDYMNAAFFRASEQSLQTRCWVRTRNIRRKQCCSTATQ